MKKLFAIMAVAGILVACNDSGKQEEPKADSTVNAAPPAPAPADTTAPAPAADTTAPKADTSAAKH